MVIKRQSGRFVDLAGEKAGRFDDQHFERRLHPAFQQMSAVGGAVGFSDHDMQSKVADERKDFDLLMNFDVAIGAFFEIEITEHHATQRADAGKSRGGEILLNRDLQQAGGGFFGGIENGGNGALRRFSQDFDLHGASVVSAVRVNVVNEWRRAECA